MVPVEEHGASTSTASNGSADHSATSAQTSSACSDKPAEIVTQPVQSRRRAVDRRDEGAGSDKLRGLAAGRSAEIGDAQPCDIAEQARRQRGGGILDPPRAVGKAGQRRDGATNDRAHRPVGSTLAVQRCGPGVRIALHA